MGQWAMEWSEPDRRLATVGEIAALRLYRIAALRLYGKAPIVLPMDPIHATRQLITLALEEDIGSGDLTALAVPPEIRARARLVAKEDCVLSGLELAALVLEVFGADGKATVAPGLEDGKQVKAGTTVLSLDGRARDLLTTERTFLNLLQRTCGVATQASRYKEALAGAKLTVLDTRKTTPGLRYWEKKAVRDGGLTNHRMRLDDGVLIKENHIAAAGGIAPAMHAAMALNAGVSIQVEVESLDELEQALAAGATSVLLDNFSLQMMRDAVRLSAGRAVLEASGGINMATVRAIAETGVDRISIGSLTKDVKATDYSLRIVG